MGVSNKVRSKHLAKANEILDAAGQPRARTILLGHKKFSLTPTSVGILIGSLVVVVGVFAIFKVIIFGGALLGAAIGGFLQTSKPNRGVGIIDGGFVLFSRSAWTGKPNKIVGMDAVMPFTSSTEATLCGETVVFSGSEVQYGRTPLPPAEQQSQPQQFAHPQQQNYQRPPEPPTQ